MTRRVEERGWFLGSLRREMDVLGHENVGVEKEVMGAAGSFDDLFEDFFGLVGFEAGKTMVTAEGDEVEMT